MRSVNPLTCMMFIKQYLCGPLPFSHLQKAIWVSDHALRKVLNSTGIIIERFFLSQYLMKTLSFTYNFMGLWKRLRFRDH